MSATHEHDELLREDPAVPLDLRRAFAAYGDISPDREARDALLRSIEQTLREPSVTATRSHRALYLTGLTLAGLMLAALVVWRGPEAKRPPHAAVPVVASLPVPAHTKVESELRATRTPAPAATTYIEPMQEKAPDVHVERAGTRAPRPLRKPVVDRAAATAQPSAVSDPAGELALLTRAKRVLASDAGAALALTGEHAARFAHGVFAEEREVIAIEALMRRGDEAEATQRAQRFRTSYPRSTHLDRLRVVLRKR